VSGNTAQDAELALFNNLGSSTTGTASSVDFAAALALYQYQITQQMLGTMFGSSTHRRLTAPFGSNASGRSSLPMRQ
jgi:hypothetical protein